MGVDRKVIQNGDGKTYPQVGDTVHMAYTGWLYSESAPNNRGEEFDTSRQRGDLVTKIGVGRVIKGWDDGIRDMSLGEKATLTISSDFAYGARGFPGVIPANAQLIFDVELNKIEKSK